MANIKDMTVGQLLNDKMTIGEILNIDGSTIDIERSVAISEMFERRISPLSTIMDSHTQASDDSRTDLVLRIV